MECTTAQVFIFAYSIFMSVSQTISRDAHLGRKVFTDVSWNRDVGLQNRFLVGDHYMK